jgi:formylglycine-generating enzyme required for sulfatase activity
MKQRQYNNSWNQAIASAIIAAAALTANAAETNPALANYTEKIPGGTVSFDMVAIPGGTIKIGSASGEAGRDSNDLAQAAVTVKPFWMGKCEVTWAEYIPFVFSDKDEVEKSKADGVTRPTKPYGSIYRERGEKGFPAIGMSQLSATEFCKWLSWKTGKKYRLPTEAEWEYACRAGAETPYFWGASADQAKDYGWFADNSQGTTQPCGKLKPNKFGLHDVVGNVSEWTVMTSKDTPGVVRGGAFTSTAAGLRSAARMIDNPSWNELDPQSPPSIWWLSAADFVGIRVVRSADGDAATAEAKPAVMAAAAPAASGAEAGYKKYCAGCHGATGKGDTTLGKRNKARDYTDPAVQATLKDDAMFKAVKEGVSVEGKVVMHPIGDKMTDDEIKAVVAYMKTFK